jgi:hypothetical protein
MVGGHCAVSVTLGYQTDFRAPVVVRFCVGMMLVHCSDPRLSVISTTKLL